MFVDPSLTLLVIFMLKYYQVNGQIPTLPPYFIPSEPLQPGLNYGEPLFLTNLIEEGRIEEARHQSRVGPLPNAPVNITSYSGYLTVNKTHGSNLFFWYFPAIEEDPAHTQTFIWLQGGPGWSSLYGVFMESGPYIIYNNDKVNMRQYTWSRLFNVIYIDNPVGTGFSFTASTEGYSRNEDDVTDNLYSAVLQLFQLFPEFQANDFYVAGESYGGKYVTPLGLKLRDEKPPNIKFVGLFLGNPALTYETLEWGEVLYSLGLIDYEQRLYFQEQMDKWFLLMKENRVPEAEELVGNLYMGIGRAPSYFNNATGYLTNTNFEYILDPADNVTYEYFLTLPAVRRAIHVGNNTYSNGSIVVKYYASLHPVSNDFASLMNDYKTMLYYGGQDLLMTYRGSVKMVRDFMPAWKGVSEYRTAGRSFWRVEPEDPHLAGYVTSVGRFRHVMVRGGGHLLPFAQPQRAYDMVRRFIREIPFES